MEIYRDQPTDVTFKLPIAPDSEQVLYTVRDSAGEQRDFGTTTLVTSTQYKFTMPFTLLEFDEEFTVTWSFYINGQSQSRKTTVLVITPLITADLLEDPESFDPDLERVVRQIIENHTGNIFGYSHRAYNVRGRGDKMLQLPRKLDQLSHLSYTGYDFDEGLIVTGDGWFLENDPDEYISGSGTVITAPYAGGKRYVFKEDRLFTVRGYWGWPYVPEEVRDAAMLLYNDLACMDSKYRTKYIKSIYFAGTRMEFLPDSWVGTGNKIADDLLADYVRPRMLLI